MIKLHHDILSNLCISKGLDLCFSLDVCQNEGSTPHFSDWYYTSTSLLFVNLSPKMRLNLGFKENKSEKVWCCVSICNTQLLCGNGRPRRPGYRWPSPAAERLPADAAGCKSEVCLWKCSLLQHGRGQSRCRTC